MTISILLKAVAVIFDFIKDVNRTITENEKINLNFYRKAKSFLEKTAEGVLGILDFNSLLKTSDGKLEGDLIELLIQLRIDAKKEKNFPLADKIRDELNKLGIILEDSKEKTTYKITRKD